MLRQFGTAVKERVARVEMEVPVKGKVDSASSKGRAAAPGSSSKRREERREGSRLVDRTNGVGTKVGDGRGDGRTQGLDAVDPPSTRTTTTAQGSCSSRGSSTKLEEATGGASPATEVQRSSTFKEPLPPTRREGKSAAAFRSKDMPPPPVPRRASSSREEQMPPPPPAIKEQRQVAPAAKAASPAPIDSPRSPPIMKKSMSPVPHRPHHPAPEKKSTAMWVAEDGDVSMTSSAADTSYGNSFENDPGEVPPCNPNPMFASPEVSAIGQIFVRDQLKQLIPVGVIDYSHKFSHGNPVLAYLQRRGVESRGRSPVVLT